MDQFNSNKRAVGQLLKGRERLAKRSVFIEDIRNRSAKLPARCPNMVIKSGRRISMANSVREWFFYLQFSRISHGQENTSAC